MKTKDLSKGKPLKLLIMFSLPMVLSVVFQQLYNIADSVIAGQFLGKEALAAVSVSYPITMIYMCVGTGLSVGCGVIMSRTYGLKKYSALKTAVSTSFLSVLAIGLVMILVGYFTAEPLLKLLSTPDEIIADAAKYLKIYALGMVFVYIYNACSVSFQALGNSKIPLVFLISSTVLNVILDIAFLYLPNADLSVLSTATVIAQGIAAVGSVLVLVGLLTKVENEKNAENSQNNDVLTPENTENSQNSTNSAQKPKLSASIKAVIKSLAMYVVLKKSYKIFSKNVFFEIIKMGVPNVLQAATVSIGQLFVQNLINSYGTNVVAGYGAGIKISTFLIQIMITESNALSIYISQNVGAGTHDRIKQGMLSGSMIILVSVAITALVGIALAPQLVSLFAASDSSGEVIAIGTQMLRIIVPFYFVVIIKFIADALLKGTGSMSGFVTSTLLDLIFRVGFAYILSYLLSSPIGIWWSWPIGWVVGTVTAVIFVLAGGWRKKIAMYKRTPPEDLVSLNDVIGDE